MTSMKILQFSTPPPPLFIYIQNSSTPLTLDVQFQQLLSPNNNKSIKRKHNPRMTIIYYEVLIFLRSAFVYSINLLTLSAFPLTSFRSTEISLFAFTWLYTLACTYLILQSICFICMT